MTKSGFILLAFAAVAVMTRPYWLGTTAEWLTAGILILTAGIPHGSLDHLIGRERGESVSLPRFFLLYLGSLVVYFVAWMLVPGWALLFFLLITAWHFGESDLLSLGIRRKHPLLIFSYGVCITVWLLWQHPGDLQEWTAVISQDSRLMRAAVEALAAVPVMFFYGVVALILLADRPTGKSSVATRVVFLLFLYLLSHTSLLIGFVLYFAGWHSVNALFHLRLLAFRKGSLLRMMRLALPVFLLALGLLAGIACFTEVRWLEKNGLPALFVLLSVLTLPHMTEMHRLYSSQCEKN